MTSAYCEIALGPECRTVHPLRKATPLKLALEIMTGLANQTVVQRVAEDDGYLEQLASLATTARVQGPMIHKARRQ